MDDLSQLPRTATGNLGKEMCSLTQAQPLSPGIQVERKRLTSMKCFAATLP